MTEESEEWFWFELALAFGIPVEELQSRMSWREFVFWQARYRAQPFGTEWENIRSAAISANVCAATSGKAQKIQEHIPRERKRRRKQSPQEQAMILNMAVAQTKQAKGGK
jgi:hypothetical protein